MVLDLKIVAGRITAVVAGSQAKPYNIVVTIQPLAATLYEAGARLDRQPAMFFELRGAKLDVLVGVEEGSCE